MNRIIPLPPEVVGQIDAGEVVERPSAAIKELVENSLDAGATAVTVEIRDGGITYFRVTDNGSGIQASDLKMAFERHATSKIRSQQDLYGVQTLGFRGEALASIAAVSRVRCATRTADAESGMQLLNEGGQITEIREAACPVGTSITVKDLFYNAPVRKKFLKKTAHETASVTELMARLILSRPDISFRYTADGKNVYFSAGDGKLESSVLSVYGLDVLRLMTPISGTMNGVALNGYVGVGDVSRSNRSQEYFFLNNRVMKSQLLSAAVETGCRQRVMIGRFPMCVLHLTMPFENADVNVHPNKWEVRFQNEAAVRDAVETLVRDTLTERQQEALLTPRLDDDERIRARCQPEPNVTSVEVRPAEPETRQTIFPKAAPNVTYERTPVPSFHEPRAVFMVEEPTEEPAPANSAPLPETDLRRPEPEQTVLPPVQTHIKPRLIGVAFLTYILFEYGDQLVLCDQHAAHERLLYERLMRETKAGPASQTLLIPEAVPITRTQYAAYLDNRDVLVQIGFDVDAFGEDTLQLRGLPVILGQPEAAGCLIDTLDELAQYGKLDPYDKVLRIAQTACKHAVKGGERVPEEELQWLIEQILNGDLPPTCPHGRPLMVTVTRTDLDKRFRRIQQR